MKQRPEINRHHEQVKKDNDTRISKRKSLVQHRSDSNKSISNIQIFKDIKDVTRY